MSLCTLHKTHQQLSILSATSPWRGKLESKNKAVVVMWDAETVTGPAHNPWVLEEEEPLPRQQRRMPTHEKINKQKPVAIKHSDTEFKLPYDFVWFYVLDVFLNYFFMVSILCPSRIWKCSWTLKHMQTMMPENMFKCHSHNRALTLPCLSNTPVYQEYVLS